MTEAFVTFVTKCWLVAHCLQAYEDESFVLPALLRFGGEPVVDEATGVLLYKFPSLQKTAQVSNDNK